MAFRTARAVLFSVTAGLLPFAHAQPPPEVTIPQHLKVTTDYAASLDLGGTRRAPWPKRADPKGPITEAAYVCLRCRAEGLQAGSAKTPQAPEELLFGGLGEVRRWLDRLDTTEATVLGTPRWVLACSSASSRATGLRPDELARLRAWFPSLAPKPAKLTAHEVAHLWAERLQDVDAALGDLLDQDEHGELRMATAGYRPLAHRHAELYLVGSDAAHAAFVEHIFDGKTRPLAGMIANHGPVGLVHAPDLDDAIRRRFIYGASLQLARRHWRIGPGLQDWLLVGIAHLLERRYVDLPPSHEDTAGTIPEFPKPPPRDWDQVVKDLVVAGKSAPLAALSRVPERALSYRSRLQAWSTVRFLLSVDSRRFATLTNALLRTHPDVPPDQALGQAMQSAYDADLATIERAWKAFVLK